jgi:predicted  nucleic acid-binding Zn-ribbon protein
VNHGVKLVRLSVQDVGPLVGRIDLGPFSSGVSVISGRNEVGKSTLVEALRMALFERHDAKHQRIKALQTHGTRNAPEIWVELDIGGERVSVHKRFVEKPLVEVRLSGGGPALQGSEAEDLLLARLDGRRAGRTGGDKNDMGLWGLLWVTQDDTAYTDPGQALDDSVRGALSEAVGRQVGQVLGGKRSEQVRTQVLENARRYWGKTGNARSGEYRTADEKRAAADERVKNIEKGVAEVEDLAVQLAAVSEQLLEKDRQFPGLEEEHSAAIASERRLRALGIAAERAEEQLSMAEAELDAVDKAVAGRALLTDEAAELDGQIQKTDNAVAELAKTLEHLTAEAREARSRAAEAKAAAVDARAAVDACAERLDEARRREEATRVTTALGKAEEVANELAAAERQAREEALDERTFEELERLAGKAADLRARLDADGTRIIVYPPKGEPIIRAVAAPSTVDVPGLGLLEIEPAGPGLAQAVADAGKRRAKFDESLLSLGVSGVQAAKDRYAARAEAEAEAEVLIASKQKLAPKGLEALEQKVTVTQAERARLSAALVEASRADSELEECVRKLGTNRLNEDAIEGLRQKAQALEVVRAASEAMGTQVQIVALADLRLRAGNAAAADALAAGQSWPLTLTQPTTILLEGIAELKFEPRGEDLAKSRAKLARAEHELAGSLEALEMATMKDAEEAARGWARLDETRKRAEARLQESAPQGIQKLRNEVERAREKSRAQEESLAEAKRAFALHAQIEVDLAQERVTKEALARLKKLERELRESDGEVERLRARVRAVKGPVAEGTLREWVVSEPMRPAAVAGVDWEIVPGELGGGLDIEGTERRLRDVLATAGVVDLAAAKGRYKAGVKLSEQIASLGRQLRSIAPGGLDVLRARAVVLGGAASTRPLGAEADDAVMVASLQTAAKQLDERSRAAQVNAETSADIADRAERARDAHHGFLREARVERKTRAERRDVLIARLGALREVEADAVLMNRLSLTLSGRDAARDGAREAAAAVDAATPRLLDGEVARAAGAILSWRKSQGKLSDDALRLKTLLNKAAIEGRFEELEDARAEQAVAIDCLARIEREAGAARLLATVVDEAYAESQRLFLAPVLKEAAPYLTRLRPGTEIRMTRDLKLDKIVRRGTEEDFGQLSGGTREQLSVIVRLALARVMARDQRPLPLILDDTMGWTDDGRFLSMVQILRDASSELQVILLTCHAARFDRFQAEYSVDLDRLKDARSPDGA